MMFPVPPAVLNEKMLVVWVMPHVRESVIPGQPMAGVYLCLKFFLPINVFMIANTVQTAEVLM
ncbi:hypothetical protein SDC9_164820 [bioreactor metagenome]|uniref:Uncharacterized protein n=1 Tax=bioreactor metagenome TaxID=1076179 RepID=A0A645FSP1_9ZZZZ